MRKYQITFWNDTRGHEGLVEAWEISRERLTRRDHREIVERLFMESCYEGVYAKYLSATVADITGGSYRMLPISYDMVNKQDGSTVWADLFVCGQFVRHMTIGD